jgi:hypothetical protein
MDLNIILKFHNGDLPSKVVTIVDYRCQILAKSNGDWPSKFDTIIDYRCTDQEIKYNWMDLHFILKFHNGYFPSKVVTIIDYRCQILAKSNGDWPSKFDTIIDYRCTDQGIINNWMDLLFFLKFHNGYLPSKVVTIIDYRCQILAKLNGDWPSKFDTIIDYRCTDQEIINNWMDLLFFWNSIMVTCHQKWSPS